MATNREQEKTVAVLNSTYPALTETPFLDYLVAGFVVLFFSLLYYLLNGGLLGNTTTKPTGQYTLPWLSQIPTKVSANTDTLAFAPLKLDTDALVNAPSITESLKPISAQVETPVVPLVVNTPTNPSADNKLLLEWQTGQQTALTNLRNEMTTQQQTELVKLRNELEAKHQAELEKLRNELNAKVDAIPPAATSPIPNQALLPVTTGTLAAPVVTQATSSETQFEQELSKLFATQKANTPLIFDNINFEMGSNQLTAQSKTQVNKVAELLKQYPDVKILIQGHTDNIGDVNQNTLLSLTRSNNMKKALVAQGISEDRIKIEGMGSLKPIASNDTEEGRAKNRRIELSIIELTQ